MNDSVANKRETTAEYRTIRTEQSDKPCDVCATFL